MSEQLYVLADDGFSIRNTETGKRFFTLNSLKKELNEKQAEIKDLKVKNIQLETYNNDLIRQKNEETIMKLSYKRMCEEYIKRIERLESER